MFVINRKKISIIAICLVLGIFAYSYQSAKINNSQELKETTSVPSSNKVVVVDAGHGKPDERCRK